MGEREDEFERAVEAAYPALARAAVVLCGSRSDADDVVQETVLRAFKSYPSFRGQASFFTWVYTILARVAHATNQSRSRPIPADYAVDRPQALPPVDRTVMANEQARALIDAVRSLPERQREMITLYFLEELSYSEIAAALTVSVGTVKATMFQAKTALRSALAKNGIRRKAAHVLS